MNMKMTTCGIAAVLVLAGCGSSDSSTPSDASTQPDASSQVGTSDGSTDFNDADVMFAQMMIPHHEQAIELADIARDPAIGASEEVRALAEQVKGAQDPEIDLMTSLLTAWGQSATMDSSVDHSTMMSGMLTLDELATVSQARGAEFDRAWLEAMIAHHEGAIEMAEDVLADGVNADVRALAEQIIAAQRAEIEEMRALLG